MLVQRLLLRCFPHRAVLAALAMPPCRVRACLGGVWARLLVPGLLAKKPGWRGASRGKVRPLAKRASSPARRWRAKHCHQHGRCPHLPCCLPLVQAGHPSSAGHRARARGAGLCGWSHRLFLECQHRAPAQCGMRGWVFLQRPLPVRGWQGQVRGMLRQATKRLGWRVLLRLMRLMRCRHRRQSRRQYRPRWQQGWHRLLWMAALP